MLERGTRLAVELNHARITNFWISTFIAHLQQAQITKRLRNNEPSKPRSRTPQECLRTRPRRLLTFCSAILGGIRETSITYNYFANRETVVQLGIEKTRHFAAAMVRSFRNVTEILTLITIITGTIIGTTAVTCRTFQFPQHWPTAQSCAFVAGLSAFTLGEARRGTT